MIKAGYMIEVSSWENDADYRKTTTVSGLSKTQVLFYHAFLQKFISRHADEKPNFKTFGNLNHITDYEWQDIYSYVREISEKYKSADFSFLEGDETDDNLYDIICETSYDLLGGSEFLLFRVFEDIKIYYIPETINEVKIKEM